ncbi:hypothetical protein BC833DRAFT_585930 [Globomyces pollinis-pini]|nr:hypothetical protein BC833DRAFT_585930 [Globomyces pollinis-pini]
MTLSIPLQNPNKTPPSRKLVFVDPDDVNATHWWPAMVVPQKEWSLFNKTTGGKQVFPKHGELLVSYFEDGSFSIVSEKDTKPFSPLAAPYTDYLKIGNNFCKDKGVLLATLYWQTGKTPHYFQWLRDPKRKVKQTLPKTPESQTSHTEDSVISPIRASTPLESESDTSVISTKSHTASYPSLLSVKEETRTESPHKKRPSPDTSTEPCILSKKQRWMAMYMKSQQA